MYKGTNFIPANFEFRDKPHESQPNQTWDKIIFKDSLSITNTDSKGWATNSHSYLKHSNENTNRCVLVRLTENFSSLARQSRQQLLKALQRRGESFYEAHFDHFFHAFERLIVNGNAHFC